MAGETKIRTILKQPRQASLQLIQVNLANLGRIYLGNLMQLDLQLPLEKDHDFFLNKYKETDEDEALLELDTSKLIYSRFARTDGVIWNNQSKECIHDTQNGNDNINAADDNEDDDINNININNNNNKDDKGTTSFYPKTVSGRQLEEIAGGPSFSPFAKKIQSKIRDLQYEKVGTGSKTRGNNASSDRGSMFLISEEKAYRKDENESPFIDHPKKLQVHKREPKRKHPAPTPPPPPLAGTNSGKFSKMGGISSTPRHLRLASVKISLTPAQRFEKKPGTRSTNALENFQFGQLVGKGAFASVFKGINIKTKQVVAIKQILLEPDQNVADLMGEIDLLKILKHPNIVKYHGFVKTSTSLNVFLEFCSGGSLRQLYKRLGHGLPEQQIVTYAKLILQGLEYLHDQGVVHRDVKAANVLIIEETKEIKLADFGVATRVTNQYETVVGTPNWMAPETVLGGDGICTASDIWSLGATIIELLTTYPPYHELNPMATLHAIGTDDHPPLPKSISQLALLFLLECFQKQPTLRKSAKLLLKHKWITNKKRENNGDSKLTVPGGDSRHSISYSEPSFQRSINSYSERVEENWEEEFNGEHIEQKLAKKISEIPRTSTQTKLSKKDLLNKFTDRDDEDFGGVTVGGKFSDPKIVEDHDSGDEDPFLDLDINSFDTNELENQSKMDYLISKFSKRVELCYQDNGEEIYISLTKISGKMLHLIKKYPTTTHDVLIREHGILTILELLEYSDEHIQYQRLWYHCLSVLNHIFERNIVQFENFCLLGGIPMVTKFRKKIFNREVRLQVVQFIEIFNQSEKALSSFISCGGLRILSKFVEEDYDTTPEFPRVSIHLINNLLGKDLTRSKSDICRILSKYGVGFWFAVVLNRLSKEEKPPMDLVDCIVNIFKYFGQSEAKVRINVANTELFKLLIRLFDELSSFEHQLIILKFFKSMSQVSEILRKLYKAEILEFLVRLLGEYVPLKASHYKEVVNIVCPILYNCCYLNHVKELEIVKLGVIPSLKTLSKINLPFRQFVLPILCEFVYCDGYVKQQLQKHDILSSYFTLLVDPYWQSNALDSILNWVAGSSSNDNILILETPSHVDCFISGFLLPKVSNLESTLTSYLKLISMGGLKRHMFKTAIITNIITKLLLYTKNSVILLLLLRILKVFVSSGETDETKFFAIVDVGMVAEALNGLKARESSVLIDELASEILEILGETNEIDGESELERLRDQGVLQSIEFE